MLVQGKQGDYDRSSSSRVGRIQKKAWSGLISDCGWRIADWKNLKRYLKKLKFDEPVILNSFQDLTQGTGRDAEPSLIFISPRFSMVAKDLKNMEGNSQI
jgi:hypothetical protein